MKKIIAMLTLALPVACLAASAPTWDTYGATDCPACVRSDPGLGFRIMDRLRAGTPYLGDISWDDRAVAWDPVYCGGGPTGRSRDASLQGDRADADSGSAHLGGYLH